MKDAAAELLRDVRMWLANSPAGSDRHSHDHSKVFRHSVQRVITATKNEAVRL